jgi:hypothetical protein
MLAWYNLFKLGDERSIFILEFVKFVEETEERLAVSAKTGRRRHDPTPS